VITTDGLRVEYKDGFGLARSSNTMPVIVLRFEADSEAALNRIQKDFRKVILQVKPDAELPY
jgi:phosphomannomutase / phosphoglucomutase